MPNWGQRVVQEAFGFHLALQVSKVGYCKGPEAHPMHVLWQEGWKKAGKVKWA